MDQITRQANGQKGDFEVTRRMNALLQVRRRDRRYEGGVIWFTGISGAGKTTLSQWVAAELARKGHRTEILDGDLIRSTLSKGLGFSHEDRATHIRRIAFVAKLLARNRVWVLVAAISPYREIREEVRGQIVEEKVLFIEVYLRCSIEAAEKRDRKNLYRRARSGELDCFTGVSDPYEEPLAPEVILDTDTATLQESKFLLLACLQKLGLS